MKGEKPRWVKTKHGSTKNMSIGSNCRCWMCLTVMKWIDLNHFTTGQKRDKLADDLISYLAYRMGYSGCGKFNTFQKTLGVES